MRRRRGMLGLATVVLAGSLVGCAPSSLPLSIPGGTSMCSDLGAARSGSVGIPVTNTGSTPITLSDGYPNGVSEFDVLGSWIVPVQDGVDDPPIFVGEQEPDDEYAKWDQRVAPDGAVIEAGETRYLVVAAALRDDSDFGWLQGFTVTSGDGTAVTDAAWGITPGGNQCPWSPPGGNASPSPSVTP